MMVIELLVVQFMLKSYERFKNHSSAKHEFDLKPQVRLIRPKLHNPKFITFLNSF